MKIRTILTLITTHCAIGFFGFAVGIYTLPILIAPPAPDEAELIASLQNLTYRARFDKDLTDSDLLHWGEGQLAISDKFISFTGTLAPGPDYKLYLSPQFVETEADFNRLKATMVRVADVKTFNNFIVQVPPDIDPSKFNSVIIWCESFGQFITSAQYR